MEYWIGALSLVLGLIMWIIKISFKAGILDKRVEELEKDLNGLGQKFTAQIGGISDEIKTIHREIANLGERLLTELRTQSDRTNEKYVSVERFKDALRKYDTIVIDSKDDRKKIWESIDSIRENYISKQEHSAICRSNNVSS